MRVIHIVMFKFMADASPDAIQKVRSNLATVSSIQSWRAMQPWLTMTGILTGLPRHVGSEKNVHT